MENCLTGPTHQNAQTPPHLQRSLFSLTPQQLLAGMELFEKGTSLAPSAALVLPTAAEMKRKSLAVKAEEMDGAVVAGAGSVILADHWATPHLRMQPYAAPHGLANMSHVLPLVSRIVHRVLGQDCLVFAIPPPLS